MQLFDFRQYGIAIKGDNRPVIISSMSRKGALRKAKRLTRQERNRQYTDGFDYAVMPWDEMNHDE